MGELAFHEVQVDGASIAFAEAGEGPPLLFLHGWSLDHTSWMAQLSSLSARHRVVAVNLRGHGRSSGAEQPFGFARFASDVHQVASAIGLSRPIVIGHSLGGNVALDYAIAYPKETRALGIVGSDAPEGLQALIEHADGVAIQSGMLLGRLFSPRSPLSLLAPICERLFYSDAFRAARPDAIKAWREQFLANPVEPLTHITNAWMDRENPVPRLGGLAMPSLLVRGSRDRFASQATMERLAAALPGSSLHVIEGAGHMTMQEDPAAFDALVSDFAAQVPA